MPSQSSNNNESKCIFCSNKIDPEDPVYQTVGLLISKDELEEMRKFMNFSLDRHGVFVSHDKVETYVQTPVLIQAFEKITRFLMK